MDTKKGFLIRWVFNKIAILLVLGICAETTSVFAYQATAEKSDTTLVQQLLTEALRHINQGQFTEAQTKVERAKAISDSINYLDGQANSIVRLADIYLNQQRYDETIELLTNAIEAYPRSRRQVEFHNFLGGAYNYKRDDLKSLEHYKKSLELLELMPENERDRTNAGVRLNMASIYMNEGNYNEAFENFLLAVRYSEMIGDTIFWVTSLNNLGLAYNDINSYEESIYYLKKAEALAKTKNLKNDLYRIHLNLANANLNSGNFGEAESRYQQARQIEQELRPGSPSVIILYNLGRLKTKTGDYAQAEEYFTESLRHSQNMNIKPGIYYNNTGFGQLYLEMQRYEDAVPHFLVALEAALDMNSTPFVQETRQMLYTAYKLAKNYEQAFHHLEEFHVAEDSLFNVEKARELANLESKLALDRQSEINQLLQEKQRSQERRLQMQFFTIVAAALIIVLILVILFMMRKRAKEKEMANTFLQKQKEELEEVNHAKDKLFSIVAHDLRSPLTALQGILYLIKNRVLSNDDIQKLAQDLEISVQQNINSMEDLLAWASQQLAGVNMDFEVLNAKEIADNVVEKQSLMFQNKKIQIENTIGPDTLIIGDHNALQLILRNLISNSIKFTPAGGSVAISAESAGDNIILKVADTGIGIPAKDADKVFMNKFWSRKGTQNEKGTGYGLSLCREFVEKMNGSMYFESEEGKGTTFFVTLPKATKQV